MSFIIDSLSRLLPERQVITDRLRCLAYGTDASFYRLTPEVIAVVESEEEVQALLLAARTSVRSRFAQRAPACRAKLRQLLAVCVEQVIEPSGVTCCGFGGDRGFVVPELNAHALRKVHDALPSNCCVGVSTNRA